MQFFLSTGMELPSPLTSGLKSTPLPVAMSAPVTSSLELSAPVSTSLDLSAPAPVTAALINVLQSFCRDQLTFTSWASVSGRLTLATDHAQGRVGSQLTVNVQEKVVKIKDKDICFLTNSCHTHTTHTDILPIEAWAEDAPVDNADQLSGPDNLCSCEAVGGPAIKSEAPSPPCSSFSGTYATVKQEIMECEVDHEVTSSLTLYEERNPLSDPKLSTPCHVKLGK